MLVQKLLYLDCLQFLVQLYFLFTQMSKYKVQVSTVTLENMEKGKNFIMNLIYFFSKLKERVIINFVNFDFCLHGFATVVIFYRWEGQRHF